MSLIDQFEVEFNELSNFELTEGSLQEIQPVEIAGVVNQEINRIEQHLQENEFLESITIYLSNHDYKRLLKHENLLKEGLENLIQKTAKLKSKENLSNTSIVLKQDSELDKGIIKSIPLIFNSQTKVEISTIYILEINGLKKILEQQTYVLGRGTDADIQINDPGISRKHLAIEINEKIVVTDLNSTNGTFLNEEKITVLEIDESVNLRIGQTQLSIYRETK